MKKIILAISITLSSWEQVFSQEQIIHSTEAHQASNITKQNNSEYWKLEKIQFISKESPNEIQLEEDELNKFNNMYFALSENLIIANNKYRALTKKETMDSRKFFGREYLYRFYVNFFLENFGYDIAKNIQYLDVNGINEESRDFFRLLKRINLDDPLPIIRNDKLVISYSRHILIFSKSKTLVPEE